MRALLIHLVKAADVSEALELLRTSLPNPCDALGDLPVLEVAMQAPDLNAPDRQTRTREAREALVHWKLNHIPLPSPYPNKHILLALLGLLQSCIAVEAPSEDQRTRGP